MAFLHKEDNVDHFPFVHSLSFCSATVILLDSCHDNSSSFFATPTMENDSENPYSVGSTPPNPLPTYEAHCIDDAKRRLIQSSTDYYRPSSLGVSTECTLNLNRLMLNLTLVPPSSLLRNLNPSRRKSWPPTVEYSLPSADSEAPLIDDGMKSCKPDDYSHLHRLVNNTVDGHPAPPSIGELNIHGKAPFVGCGLALGHDGAMPNRRSRTRLPGVRTPPSDLWQVASDRKHESSLADMTPAFSCNPLTNLPKVALHRATSAPSIQSLTHDSQTSGPDHTDGVGHGPFTLGDQSGSLAEHRQAPIGSEGTQRFSRYLASLLGTEARADLRTSTELEAPTRPPSPSDDRVMAGSHMPLRRLFRDNHSRELCVYSSCPHVADSSREMPRTHIEFDRILATIKRNNPHAPPVPSMFNPLRSLAPIRHWAYVETIPATSKYKKPLSRFLQMLSRK